jgi:hypothetical protein
LSSDRAVIGGSEKKSFWSSADEPGVVRLGLTSLSRTRWRQIAGASPLGTCWRWRASAIAPLIARQRSSASVLDIVARGSLANRTQPSARSGAIGKPFGNGCRQRPSADDACQVALSFTLRPRTESRRPLCWRNPTRTGSGPCGGSDLARTISPCTQQRGNLLQSRFILDCGRQSLLDRRFLRPLSSESTDRLAVIYVRERGVADAPW